MVLVDGMRQHRERRRVWRGAIAQNAVIRHEAARAFTTASHVDAVVVVVIVVAVVVVVGVVVISARFMWNIKANSGKARCAVYVRCVVMPGWLSGV